MSNLGLRLNSAGFKDLLTSDDVRNDLRSRAERVLSAAQGSAPVLSGTYRNSLSIVEDTTDRAVCRVVADVDYSHTIEARTGTLARALDAGS